MNRRLFIGTISSTLAMTGRAQALSRASTAVLLSSSIPDLDGQFLDFAQAVLRERGVNVYDSSSADITYHEREIIVAEAVGSLVAVAADKVAWVEAHYHTRRVLFVQTHLSTNSLPYGDFVVHVVRATSTFRCFDTSSKAIIAAGIARGTDRGEDFDTAALKAGTRSLLALTQTSAGKLT